MFDASTGTLTVSATGLWLVTLNFGYSVNADTSGYAAVTNDSDTIAYAMVSLGTLLDNYALQNARGSGSTVHKLTSGNSFRVAYTIQRSGGGSVSGSAFLTAVYLGPAT